LNKFTFAFFRWKMMLSWHQPWEKVVPLSLDFLNLVGYLI
jgi:hypothetical protein